MRNSRKATSSHNLKDTACFYCVSEKFYSLDITRDATVYAYKTKNNQETEMPCQHIVNLECLSFHVLIETDNLNRVHYP